MLIASPSPHTLLQSPSDRVGAGHLVNGRVMEVFFFSFDRTQTENMCNWSLGNYSFYSFFVVVVDGSVKDERKSFLHASQPHRPRHHCGRRSHHPHRRRFILFYNCYSPNVEVKVNQTRNNPEGWYMGSWLSLHLSLKNTPPSHPKVFTLTMTMFTARESTAYPEPPPVGNSYRKWNASAEAMTYSCIETYTLVSSEQDYFPGNRSFVRTWNSTTGKFNEDPPVCMRKYTFFFYFSYCLLLYFFSH